MPVTFACESERPEAANWYPGCKFSPRPETLDPELITIGERLQQPKTSAINDDAYERVRRGATFGIRYTNPDDREVWLSCLGVPATRVGDCDADHGDIVCDVSLPLLCMCPDATAQPGLASTEMQGRWLAANVAASQPVRGDSLNTVAPANAHCAAEFGAGWRVVRWNDHGDGFIARGKITAERRLWIDVPETPAATCWRQR